jgi:glutathione synthase/RimK-type ligase-like ATP-grasp enzyme
MPRPGPATGPDGAPLRVALATCADVAGADGRGLDADGVAVAETLVAAGHAAHAAVWDDPAVDWGGYDVVLLRSTWDYAERRKDFLAWAAGVAAGSRLLNPLPVVQWNTDKVYLQDLAAAGVPVVPTAFIAPGEPLRLPAGGEYVVKPAVSAGSRSTGRYGPDDADTARAHAEALLAAGRTVMVQPYVASVDARGETALVYVDGAFSHALRKGPILPPGGTLITGLFAPEQIEASTATAEERAVGAAALAAVEARFGRLPYARVDVVDDAAGTPRVLEVELTEPSLFFAEGGASPTALAAAVVRHARASPDASRAP